MIIYIDIHHTYIDLQSAVTHLSVTVMVFIIKPWNTHTHIQHTVKDGSQELRRERQVERDGCQTEENAVVQGLSIMATPFSGIGNKDNYKCCCTAFRYATTSICLGTHM